MAYRPLRRGTGSFYPLVQNDNALGAGTGKSPTLMTKQIALSNPAGIAAQFIFTMRRLLRH